MLWLFVRSLFRNTVDIIAVYLCFNEKSDYLELNMILLGVIESFVSPTLISFVIWALPSKFILGQNNDNEFLPEHLFYVKLMFSITCLQSFCSYFVNFVVYYIYKGNELRNKHMVYVHYTLIIVALLITPPLAAILYAVFRFTVDMDLVSSRIIDSWLMINAISNLCVIWYYFNVFSDVINEVYYGWKEAMEYDEQEKQIAVKEAAGENITEEERSKLPPPLDPYIKRERFFGTGPLRIG